MFKYVKHTNYPILNSKNECKGLLTLTDCNDVEKKQVILVDHNNSSQSVDGLEEAEILQNELSKIFYSIKLENKEIRMYRHDIDKILSIDASIKLCYDKKLIYSNKLYIMLNDDIIGVICGSY